MVVIIGIGINKYIQKSTNMPGFIPVVLEIAFMISEVNFNILTCTIKLKQAEAFKLISSV